MIKVLIESPFAGDVERNTKYVKEAIRDCLLKGESPFASHALYTLEGILDDEVLEERKMGMEAGWIWLSAVDKVVVYYDLGVSEGMREGINKAVKMGVPLEWRSLEGRGFNE